MGLFSSLSPMTSPAKPTSTQATGPVTKVPLEHPPESSLAAIKKPDPLTPQQKQKHDKVLEHLQQSDYALPNTLKDLKALFKLRLKHASSGSCAFRLLMMSKDVVTHHSEGRQRSTKPVTNDLRLMRRLERNLPSAPWRILRVSRSCQITRSQRYQQNVCFMVFRPS